MERVMVAKRSPGIDFASRYFDDLDDWRDGVDKDLGKLNVEVFGPKKQSDLPPWYQDPKWRNIIFFISLTFLLLVAAVTKFDISRIWGAL